METNYWTYFLLTVAILVAFLGGYYSIYASRGLMRRKGYTEDYINVIRQDILQTVLGIGIVVPLLILISAYLVRIIYGILDFSTGDQLFLFSVFFIVLVTPFVLISHFRSRKKYKRLAMDTGQPVAVDLNYGVLHRMFNPVFELPATIIYGILMFLLVRNFHPAFIHLALVWLLYGMARNSRFQVRPALKDGYIYVFVFLVINQLLLVYYLVREIIQRPGQESQGVIIAGIALASLLAVKQVYYFSNLPMISRELSGK